MNHTIAAVRSGHDPVGKLPEATIHRWLDHQIVCPKCDAGYNLVCDYDWAISRHFEAESRRLITQLTKAIFIGHGDGHWVVHFETSGVVVRSFGEPPVRSKDKPLPVM